MGTFGFFLPRSVSLFWLLFNINPMNICHTPGFLNLLNNLLLAVNAFQVGVLLGQLVGVRVWKNRGVTWQRDRYARPFFFLYSVFHCYHWYIFAQSAYVSKGVPISAIQVAVEVVFSPANMNHPTNLPTHQLTSYPNRLTNRPSLWKRECTSGKRL